MAMTPALKAVVEAMAADLNRQQEASPYKDAFGRIGLDDFDLEKVARAGLEAITPSRDLLLLAALAGFAATKEGYNGECAYEHLDPDDEEIAENLAKEHIEVDACERALRLAGILKDRP